MKKSFILGLSVFALVISESALADVSIEKFFEIVPQSQCLSGQGAPARAAGTLFRGGRPNADGLKMLASTYSIKTIENFEDGSAPQNEIKLIKSLGLVFQELLHPMPEFGVLKIPGGLYDHDAMIAAVAEMRRSSNFPLFVHCTHGEDRTGMVTALHRVFNECWTPDQATAEWEKIQEPLGNEFQDEMHDYFEAVTQSSDLSEYYRQQLAKVQ